MAGKPPGSVDSAQADEKVPFSDAGIRLESGWKQACHLFRFQ
jgi:hypothetical protein